MKNNRNFIKSFSRSFNVLSIISDNDSPLTLSELSQRAQLSIATIQRITYTLQVLELLERNQQTKKFRLGPQMISLAFSAVQNLDLNKLALPYMRELAENTRESVALGVLTGVEITTIEAIKTEKTLGINLYVGTRLGTFCTSMGKAILAFLPEPKLESILQETTWKRFTPHTLTSKEHLYRELERVRIRGFSTNREETNLGVMSVAAPVRNSTGDVIAAVNLIVPSIRSSIEKLETIHARQVKKTAQKISFVMGYRNTRR